MCLGGESSGYVYYCKNTTVYFSKESLFTLYYPHFVSVHILWAISFCKIKRVCVVLLHVILVIGRFQLCHVDSLFSDTLETSVNIAMNNSTGFLIHVGEHTTPQSCFSSFFPWDCGSEQLHWGLVNTLFFKDFSWSEWLKSLCSERPLALCALTRDWSAKRKQWSQAINAENFRILNMRNRWAAHTCYFYLPPFFTSPIFISTL